MESDNVDHPFQRIDVGMKRETMGQPAPIEYKHNHQHRHIFDRNRLKKTNTAAEARIKAKEAVKKLKN